MELEVRLQFFPEEKSGRYTPIFEGTGSALQFKNTRLNCQLIFDDREFAYPGEQCRARIRFFQAIPADLKLYLGLDFQIMEGDIELGSGLILNLNQENVELD